MTAEEITKKILKASDDYIHKRVYEDDCGRTGDVQPAFIEGAEWGYNQALQDLWHNVKDETPIDGERLLLINRNGEYGTTMLMMPILYKEFRNWEKWAYIKDLIPSE